MDDEGSSILKKVYLFVPVDLLEPLHFGWWRNMVYCTGAVRQGRDRRSGRGTQIIGNGHEILSRMWNPRLPEFHQTCMSHMLGALPFEATASMQQWEKRIEVSVNHVNHLSLTWSLITKLVCTFKNCLVNHCLEHPLQHPGTYQPCSRIGITHPPTTSPTSPPLPQDNQGPKEVLHHP